MKINRLSLAVATALLLPALSQAATATDADIKAQIEALKAQIAQIDGLKSQVTALEQRLAVAEAAEAKARAAAADVATVQDDVDDMDKRPTKAQRHPVVDAIEWGGDFRFGAHHIQGDVPAHFVGMAQQRGHDE